MVKKTSKTISFISYLHEDYLIECLDQLIASKDIVWYCFIKHKADNDNTKDHIHLCIEPNGSIQISLILDNLIEADINNPLPLKTLFDGVVNSFVDYYWYILHDSDYLDFKGITRNIKDYNPNTIRTSDKDYLLNSAFKQDKPGSINTKVVEKMESGLSNSQIACTFVKTTKDFAYFNKYLEGLESFSSAKGLRALNPNNKSSQYNESLKNDMQQYFNKEELKEIDKMNKKPQTTEELLEEANGFF